MTDLWERLRFAVLRDPVGTSAMLSYFQRLTGNAARSLHWGPINATQHLTGMMQGAFSPFACRIGLPDCTTVAASLWSGWTQSGIAPPPNLRPIALGYSGAPDAVRILRGNYSEAKMEQWATLFLNGALTAASVTEAEELLTWAQTGLRAGDTWSVVLQRLFSLNDKGQEAVFQWVRHNTAAFQSLLLELDTDERRAQLNAVMDVVVGGVQLQQDLTEIRQVVDAKQAAFSEPAARRYEAAVANAQANIAFIANNWPDISAWVFSLSQQPH